MPNNDSPLGGFAWPVLVVIMAVIIGWCFAVVLDRRDDAPAQPADRHTVTVPVPPLERPTPPAEPDRWDA